MYNVATRQLAYPCYLNSITMGLERRVAHPSGLSLRTKEQVFVTRRIEKLTWSQIASSVKNKRGKRPYWKVVRAALPRVANAGLADMSVNSQVW